MYRTWRRSREQQSRGEEGRNRAGPTYTAITVLPSFAMGKCLNQQRPSSMLSRPSGESRPRSTLEKVLKDAIELKLRFPALQIRVYDAQEIAGTRSRADGANAIICPASPSSLAACYVHPHVCARKLGRLIASSAAFVRVDNDRMIAGTVVRSRALKLEVHDKE